MNIGYVEKTQRRRRVLYVIYALKTTLITLGIIRSEPWSIMRFLPNADLVVDISLRLGHIGLLNVSVTQGLKSSREIFA